MNVIFAKPMPRLFAFYACAVALLAAFSAHRLGESIFRFPYHADFEIHHSDPGPDEGLLREKIARRIFLVVVDGMGAENLAHMPRVMAWKERFAAFKAVAPFPSLSRPGYTTILTGATPEITGISSNVPERIDKRIDSFVRRAHEAGHKTAFVGLSWWMDFFDNEFDIARIDSGYARDAAIFRDGVYVDAGLAKNREVLWHGKYQESGDGWRRFIQRYKIAETFGDDPATAVGDDLLRTAEAIKIWNKNDPDFMLLHLQMPDQAGHDSGGVDTARYQKAIKETDENLARVIDAVSFRRAALLITADHGFTNTVKDAGHGGHEKAVREIPLWIAGPSVLPGDHGFARQQDIAPTLSFIAGVAFPGHNTGQILLRAFDLPEEQLNPGRFRLRQQQKHLTRALAPSRTKFVDRFITIEKWRNFPAALLLVIGILFLLTARYFWLGTFAYLTSTAGAAGLYFLIFKTLSISSFFIAWKNIAIFFVLHFACASAALVAMRRFSKMDLAHHMVLRAGIVSLVLALWIPWYALVHMPHGFLVFAALFLQIETLAIFLLWLATRFVWKPAQVLERGLGRLH